MKRLHVPIFEPRTVYEDCANVEPDLERRSRYADATDLYLAEASRYRLRASARVLFEFAASKRGQPEQLTIGGLTKGDFKRLYVDHMLGANKPARQYYDRIRNSAPHSKCPYCRLGQVKTLDHFLPKALYPAFSVLPENLVPSCIDCNDGKNAAPVSSQNLMSHPYYEDERIEGEVWLGAQIIEGQSATVVFSFIRPVGWPDDLAKRVENYFLAFDLARRFAIEAASEIVAISDYLSTVADLQARSQYLRLQASIERASRKNTWKAAMFDALNNSEWFVNLGYRLRAPALAA